MSLKETILTTDMARNMVAQVSPVYENSYVGLWLHEVIGREYAELKEIIDTLPLQLSPETATWAIELWEKRYGIIPDDSLPLETRRQAVVTASSFSSQLTPKALAIKIYRITGRWSDIVEHVSDYTFGIYLKNEGTATQVDYRKLLDFINRHKQAHMSFIFVFQSPATIHAALTTSYTNVSFAPCGTLIAGDYSI